MSWQPDEEAEVLVVETPIMKGVDLLPATAHPEAFCYRCEEPLNNREEQAQGIHEACFILEMAENQV